MLVPDIHWRAVCVAMTSGLIVGTAMTLIVGLTLYATLYRVAEKRTQTATCSALAAGSLRR